MQTERLGEHLGMATGAPPAPVGAAARRRAVVLAGFAGPSTTARAGLLDAEGSVRAASLSALERLGDLSTEDLLGALADPDRRVRLRALALAASRGTPGVGSALFDSDQLVVEAAAWATGEIGDLTSVASLVQLASGHPDPLCREAAVAALGALGDEAGLGALLGALDDQATIRRRAVLALAAFEAPEVDAALERSLGDRDWQTRQAAADVLEAGGDRSARARERDPRARPSGT